MRLAKKIHSHFKSWLKARRLIMNIYSRTFHCARHSLCERASDSLVVREHTTTRFQLLGRALQFRRRWEHALYKKHLKHTGSCGSDVAFLIIKYYVYLPSPPSARPSLGRTHLLSISPFSFLMHAGRHTIASINTNFGSAHRLKWDILYDCCGKIYFSSYDFRCAFSVWNESKRAYKLRALRVMPAASHFDPVSLFCSTLVVTMGKMGSIESSFCQMEY